MGPLLSCSIAVLATSLFLPSASIAEHDRQEKHSASEATPTRVSVLSSSRQFVVSAEDRATCLSWSIWAETTAGEIAALIGYPIPVLNAAPMVIHLGDSRESPEGSVRLFESYSDAMLIQRLHVDVDHFDEIELLAKFARALCNRYAIAFQTESERTDRLPQVPTWLTTGIAGNLTRVYRSNLEDEVAKLWKTQTLPAVASILAIGEDFEELSETELTACFLLLRWMRHIRALDDILMLVFQESARHRIIEAGDIVAVAAQLDSMRDLSIQWDIHAASFETANRPAAGADSNALHAKLHSIFDEHLSQYRIFAGQSLNLDNIIEFRDQSWIEDLVARLEIEIQIMGIHSPLDARPILKRYNEAVRQMGKGSSGFWGRFTGGGKPDSWLQERFESLSRKAHRHPLSQHDSDSALDPDY